MTSLNELLKLIARQPIALQIKFSYHKHVSPDPKRHRVLTHDLRF